MSETIIASGPTGENYGALHAARPIRSQVRQGHTRWKAILYKPGAFADQPPDAHVALVHRCFVTATFGTTVKYDTESGPYLCGREWFLRNTHASFRRAVREAQRLVDQQT